jgi:hypothetical protein
MLFSEGHFTRPRFSLAGGFGLEIQEARQGAGYLSERSTQTPPEYGGSAFRGDCHTNIFWELLRLYGPGYSVSCDVGLLSSPQPFPRRTRYYLQVPRLLEVCASTFSGPLPQCWDAPHSPDWIPEFSPLFRFFLLSFLLHSLQTIQIFTKMGKKEDSNEKKKRN